MNRLYCFRNDRIAFGLFILFILGYLIFMPSCKKEDGLSGSESLARSQKIAPDFSYFEKQTDDSSHFNNAVRALAFWKAALNDSVALQKKIYNEALSHSFEKQNENTHLVAFEMKAEEKSYRINLFNILENDTVAIKMFVNQDTLYKDFLMIDGYESKISGRQSVLLYKRSSDNKPLKMMMVESFSAGRTIYTGLMPGTKNGHSLECKDSTDGNFDKYMNLYDKTTEESCIIQWSSSGGEGRMKSKMLYNDRQWRCWGADKKDRNCD